MSNNIEKRLWEMQDIKYKEFQAKLMPTVPPECIIGVRMPKLREYAKEIFGTQDAEDFLSELPHKYYDENTLHGVLISMMKNYEQAVAQTDKFLPYVDNWATCDLMSPKVFGKHRDEFILKIREWISSDMPFTVRFGIEMLMTFYLNDSFKPEYNELVAGVSSEEYYVKMMVAWYFATALAKQYDDTLPYIENKRLKAWEHNKTIQKAIESYRITDGQKAYLRSLKA